MKVGKLLSDKSKWCKKKLAATKDGESCLIFDEFATQWCLEGAIIKCYVMDFETQRKINERIRNKIGNDIPNWNDAPERTFEDVKKLVKKLNI